jgi:hypothetical protein
MGNIVIVIKILVSLRIAAKEFLNITVMETFAITIDRRDKPEFTKQGEKVKKTEPIIYKIN